MARTSFFTLRQTVRAALLTLSSGVAVAQAATDWPALARAHDAALRKYQATPAGERPRAREAACLALRAAGAERAIADPVAGVSARQAAEILNDYGFLATPACATWPLPERAIRRALVLDPQRRVAHLNLADALRADLEDVVRADEDVDARRAEIRREYQAFIAGGGKRTDEMRHWPDAPPALPPHAGVCATVAAYLRADRLTELQSARAQGLAIDGRRVDARFEYEGTGIAPHLHYKDASSGEDIETEVGGDTHTDGALLALGGHHQALVSTRGIQEATLVALDGGEGCDIEGDRVESVAPESAEPAFCRRVVAGTGLREIELDEPSPITEEALAVRWTGEMSGVQAQGSALVDLANDGRPVRLLRITTQIRQPDTCTVQLVELASADGKRLATDAERRALAARGIEADDPQQPAADCYGERHYLVDGARTVVESLGHSPGDAARPFGRSVDIDERGKWRTLCVSSFEQRWTVKPSAPAK